MPVFAATSADVMNAEILEQIIAGKGADKGYIVKPAYDEQGRLLQVQVTDTVIRF